MPDVGAKYAAVMRFEETCLLAEEYVDAAKAKDGKMFPKKPEQPYGKGDKLSTPEKDKRAKDPVPATETLPHGVEGELQLRLAMDGIDPRGTTRTFQSPVYAYRQVLAILSSMGLCAMEEVEADALALDSAGITIKVGKVNPDGADNPIPTSTSISLKWTVTQPNQISTQAEVSTAKAQPTEEVTDG